MDNKKPAAGGILQKGDASINNTSFDNVEWCWYLQTGFLWAQQLRIQELFRRIDWKWRVTELDGLSHQ